MGAQRRSARKSADEPPALVFSDGNDWTLGEPELVLRSADQTRPAVGPDWWGDIGLVPTGLTEDRYVKSIEVREVNDIPDIGSSTVGGRYIFHHMTYQRACSVKTDPSILPDTSISWPIHEVGRNADVFPESAGRLLQAGSALHLRAAHMHSNGRETTDIWNGITFFLGAMRQSIPVVVRELETVSTLTWCPIVLIRSYRIT